MEEAHFSSLLYPFINLAILVGGLFYFLRTPTKVFVRSRHSYLKEELNRVQARLSEAQRQYQDYSQRLSAVDGEITNLIQSVRSEAEASKIRILTEARRSAD